MESVHEHTWQTWRSIHTFKARGSAESNLYAYWNNFLSKMAPVLRDLAICFRDTDWYLHLSSASRSIDLCLIAPIISGGCLSIMRIVLHCTSVFVRCTNLSSMEILFWDTLPGKAVLLQWPMDPDLGKAYNKSAKSSAGIIGFTRRKEDVCKWDLIKHEKAKYRNLTSAFIKWMRVTSIACTMNF